MKVSEELFKILEESDVKQIRTDTQVDEFSKKLKLTEHVRLLVAFVLLQFISLGDLCEHADKYEGLIKSANLNYQKSKLRTILEAGAITVTSRTADTESRAPSFEVMT